MKVAQARRKVMVIASGGGHSIQHQRLSNTYREHDVVYVAADEALASEVPPGCFHTVTDSSREEPFLLIRCAFQRLGIGW